MASLTSISRSCLRFNRVRVPLSIEFPSGQSGVKRTKTKLFSIGVNIRCSTAAYSSEAYSKKMTDPAFLTKHYDPAVKELVKTLELAKTTSVPTEVIKGIEHSLKLCQRRDEFADNLTTDESDVCNKIKEETLSHNWSKVHEDGKSSWNLNPVMMSGHLEGKFLQSFLNAQKAKRVLEVGMFTGYSALSIAEILPKDGQIVTLDIEDYLKDLVQSLISASPHKDKIHIIIGKALESMASMKEKGEKFDAVFMDAAKSEYKDYLELCLGEGGLLEQDGTIIVDNAFMHGSSYLDPDSPAAKFSEYLKTRQDLHVVLVPLRDGMYLIRRQQDVTRQ